MSRAPEEEPAGYRDFPVAPSYLMTTNLSVDENDSALIRRMYSPELKPLRCRSYRPSA